MGKELEMSFDPHTIEHLGVRMYSTLPPVLAELIANSYDADSEFVKITLNDEKPEKEITIEDDGIGMTFDEINDSFLRIGRNRRKEEKIEMTPKGRSVIGKKGLGKLSFFGIAHEIEITTKKKAKKNVFSMDWEDIKNAENKYKPRIIKKDENCSEKEHGTTIVLKKIQRDTDFPAENIADSISKMFIVDSTFKISVQRNLENPIVIDNDRKYEEIEKQIEWHIPKDFQNTTDYKKADYDNAPKVTGRLIASGKPIPPKSNMRGIALFSRNKLVNNPEYFSDSTSSHFFSYLTGQLEVNFIDDLSDDVISTNRQSLNWGHPEMEKLRNYLRSLVNWLERDWRNKREEKRKEKLSEATGINISDWFEKLPQELRGKVEPIVKAIMRDSELPEETNRDAVKKVHEITPEYPYFHWRYLHGEIKIASGNDYRKGDYYRAFQEAAKRYINAVKTKSGSINSSEASMMGEVFGNGTSATLLKVAQNFKKPNGGNFQTTTINNIEEGQKFLSMGVVSGCRNPVSHEEIEDLRDSGLFTEKDCLDALSLLSHLFSRLDNSQK